MIAFQIYCFLHHIYNTNTRFLCLKRLCCFLTFFHKGVFHVSSCQPRVSDLRKVGFISFDRYFQKWFSMKFSHRFCVKHEFSQQFYECFIIWRRIIGNYEHLFFSCIFKTVFFLFIYILHLFINTKELFANENVSILSYKPI